jgi:Holliday junction resolvase
MGKLSRNKGKVGEREVVNLIKKHGFEARRGQQFKGTKDSPDVIHDMDGFYVEVKRRQAFNIYDTLVKADAEKPEGTVSVVFHRKDNRKWLVSMDADEFLAIIKELFDD